ncbi:hypothetical protein [uncultured Psychroserpens sp.]|uniref:hypothetical protein n=1 Tax=uncultured Psychroserpens sp. TaxID=255436 RepID=UPI00262FFC39|nr:hypothetical protein [uncultured Psychroserpens sp.]
MKTIKSIVFGICVLSFINVNSQNLSQKQIERQKNKVELFSVQEFSNLHFWFHNKVQDLKLSNDVEEQYSYIISKYTYKMSRLDDKDSTYSYNEMVQEIHVLIDKTNTDLKPILTQKQYRENVKIMNTFKELVLNKLELKYSQNVNQ